MLEAGRRYGMHVVNLRLAMVYGSGGRGNLERMGRLVQRGLFPPLPETGNHRSLVHVDDVVAAMRLVAEDDRANGRTYIVAAPEAPSGRELFDALREVLGMPPFTWAVPASALRLAGRVGDGLEAITRRRLPLDSEALERLLGSAWYSPAPHRARTGLARAGVTSRWIAGDVRKVKRIFDLFLALIAAVVLVMPIMFVAVAVKLTSRGPALYWSDRVGRHNRIFRMPKFRSMRVDTPAVATHLLNDPTRLTRRRSAPSCASRAWMNCPSYGAFWSAT